MRLQRSVLVETGTVVVQFLCSYDTVAKGLIFNWRTSRLSSLAVVFRGLPVLGVVINYSLFITNKDFLFIAGQAK